MVKGESAGIGSYEEFVGAPALDELIWLAGKLSGERVHVVTSSNAADVVDMLNQMLPLLSELGVDVKWSTLRERERFQELAGRLLDGLHGKPAKLETEDRLIFQENTQRNLDRLKLDEDIVLAYGPEPLGLVQRKGELGNSWLWGCPTDISHATPEVWDFLHQLVLQYDRAVLPAPDFSRPLGIREFVAPPVVDPLGPRNIALDESALDSLIKRCGIHDDKPMIVQVAPFDCLRDPFELIEVFNSFGKDAGFQYIMAGAARTAQVELIADSIREHAAGNRDIHVISLASDIDMLTNALRSSAALVVQQPMFEGCNPMLVEALWKEKPVVAYAGRGASAQIKHRISGLLVSSAAEMAAGVQGLLGSPEHAGWLGRNGREWVRHNSLIFHQLRDYLLLFLSLKYHPGTIQSDKSW